MMPRPDAPSVARLAMLVSRALGLRCPNCGRGRLLASWFRLRETCPSCGVWLEREEGYFLGAMALNLVVSELVPTLVCVALLVVTWPNPPWSFLQVAAPLAMGLMPVLFFPFARMLWLALDWTFRPPSLDRRADHPRPGPSRNP